MEAISEARACSVRRRDAVPARVPRTVHRSMHGGRVLAEVLHDVDLTALRPAHFIDVLAEHPKRGPDPPAPGQPYPRLDQPVTHGHTILADQARGRVSASAVAAVADLRIRPAHHDGKVAGAVEAGVLAAAGVVLEFVVSPAVPAGLRQPGVGVGRRARGAIELFRPGKGVSGAPAGKLPVHSRLPLSAPPSTTRWFRSGLHGRQEGAKSVPSRSRGFDASRIPSSCSKIPRLGCSKILRIPAPWTRAGPLLSAVLRFYF